MEERIRRIDDADDDVSSLSSLSSTNSSDSSSGVVENHPALLVAAAAAADGVGATRITQPLLEKRLLQMNKAAAGTAAFRNTCKGKKFLNHFCY